MPTVSVLMPAYNAAKFIQPAIESALRQSCEDIEVVVVDDGSTDETRHIVEAVCRVDQRVVLIAEGRNGLQRALNVGLRRARGTWIARLDADDVASSRRLERQLDIALHDECVLVGSGAELIDEASEHLWFITAPESDSAVRRLLRRGVTPFAHSTALFQRDVALSIGGYDERMVTSEDFDLWLRLSRRGKVGASSEPLIQLRKHRGAVTRLRPSLEHYYYSLSALALDSALGQNPSRPNDGGEELWRELFLAVRRSPGAALCEAAIRARATLREARYSGGARGALLAALRRPPLMIAGFGPLGMRLLASYAVRAGRARAGASSPGVAVQ